MSHLTNIRDGLEPRRDLKICFDYYEHDVNGDPEGEAKVCIRDAEGRLVIGPHDLIGLVANLDQVRDAMKAGVDEVGKHLSDTEATSANSAHADLCQALDIIGWGANAETHTFIPDHALAVKVIKGEDVIKDVRFEYIFRQGSVGAGQIAAEAIAALIAWWKESNDYSIHMRGVHVDDVAKAIKKFGNNKELLLRPEPPATLPKLDGIPGAVWAIKQASPNAHVVAVGFKKIEVYQGSVKTMENCIATMPSTREIVDILRAYALVDEG